MAISNNEYPIGRLEQAYEGGKETLSRLLKRCRSRINRERQSLGQYLRLPMRIGKAVTQEEVAEAVGISRQWYGMMEMDRPVRVSATILSRIADVLMMDPCERATLFLRAIPELTSTSLSDASTAMLEALGALRRVTRWLWAASSEDEVLTVVREHAMTHLAPDVMVTSTRVGEGDWRRTSLNADPGDDRIDRFHALIAKSWGMAAIDDLYCYTLLSQPGDTMTDSERNARLPLLAASTRKAREAVELRPDVSLAIANIRSHRGFIGRLVVYHKNHAYSVIELAQLGTLAELTSLALSGFAQ